MVEMAMAPISELEFWKDGFWSPLSFGMFIFKDDPNDIAKVVYKAITSKRPKRIYHVNVSLRFKALSVLPRKVKEFALNMLLDNHRK